MSSPCYCHILRAATRKVGAIYDAALEPAGINIGQFILLRRVAAAQPVALTELGRMAELDRSTIGRNVRVIQKMGLVTLGRGEDQREAAVSLTETGGETLRRAVPLWQAAQAEIEAKLGAGTAQDVRTSLAAL